MGDCYTRAASAKFGPLPSTGTRFGEARILAHKDKLPSLKFARIPEFYWYDRGSNDDRAFGMTDIQFLLEFRSPSLMLLTMNYSKNGHEGGSGGTPYSQPLTIQLLKGNVVLDSKGGVPYSIPCYSSDSGNYIADFSSTHFNDIDTVRIPAGEGFSVTCGGHD